MSENEMNTKNEMFSKPQFYILLLLRLVIGYHFLSEGLNKLFAANWSSGGFLSQSNWIFSNIFIGIANSPTFVAIADILNIWGQIFIGLGLILGLYSKYAAYAGALLILLYYLAIPPFKNGYTFVDRNLLEFFGLLVTAFFHTSSTIGFDGFLRKIRSGNNA